MEGKHDDSVITMGILHYIRENAPAEIRHAVSGNSSVAERIMARLEAKKHQSNTISQDDYL
jgi:hypothetical protein